MKILFLGYPDSPLIPFMREKGDAVFEVSPDEKIETASVLDGRFDFLVSYGYLHILKGDLLSLFPQRAINLHIAYLPWNRGKDPNFWSFIEGTPKGVTIHALDTGIDTGDILFQREIFFDSTETLKTSYEKLRKGMEKLFFKNWEEIRKGNCPRKKQAQTGSFHLARDKEPLLHLLTQSWDTPVATLVDFGRANNRFIRG